MPSQMPSVRPHHWGAIPYSRSAHLLIAELVEKGPCAFRHAACQSSILTKGQVLFPLRPGLSYSPLSRLVLKPNLAANHPRVR